MRKMMMSYDPDTKEYARLAGFGYRMLAEAINADQPDEVNRLIEKFISEVEGK